MLLCTYILRTGGWPLPTLLILRDNGRVAAGLAAICWHHHGISFVFNGLWCISLAGLLMHYHLTPPHTVKMACFQMHTRWIEWRCISYPCHDTYIHAYSVHLLFSHIMPMHERNRHELGTKQEHLLCFDSYPEKMQ